MKARRCTHRQPHTRRWIASSRWIWWCLWGPRSLIPIRENAVLMPQRSKNQMERSSCHVDSSNSSRPLLTHCRKHFPSPGPLQQSPCFWCHHQRDWRRSWRPRRSINLHRGNYICTTTLLCTFEDTNALYVRRTTKMEYHGWCVFSTQESTVESEPMSQFLTANPPSMHQETNFRVKHTINECLCLRTRKLNHFLRGVSF